MISVIVPVYNAEKYIRRCVESILSQSNTDWELLLVDDGSHDSSGIICDEYATRDSRIRVFHKQNGGVSSARNMGLDKARGEWICFIDSDDYIQGVFLPDLSQSNSDLIIQNSLNVFPNIVKQSEPKMVKCRTKCRLQRHAFLSLYLNYSRIRTPWAKFFKKDLIENLRFDVNVNIGEDTIFVYTYLKRCKRIETIHSGDYMYVVSQSEESKYAMSIERAIFLLDSIFAAYENLGIRNTDFQNNTIMYFQSLCSFDKKYHSELWNSSQIIKKYPYQHKKRYLNYIYTKLNEKIISI